MAATHTHIPTSAGEIGPGHRAKGSLWRRGAVAAACAAVVNAAIWGSGRAADVGFVVPGRSGGESRVSISHVVVLTLASLAIGTAVAALAAIRSRRWWRGVVIAGVAVSVLSATAPLSLDAEIGTRLLLASMHLVVGAAFLVAVRGDISGPSRARRPDSAMETMR